MNVVEAIRQKYPGMTKKQKALAEYMLAQPDSMSFMTLKALAAAAQVSEMTILHGPGLRQLQRAEIRVSPISERTGENRRPWRRPI